MTRNSLAFGVVAIGLFGAVACQSAGGAVASSPSRAGQGRAAVRTVPSAPTAPAPASSDCRGGPPRRAFAEEVSASGTVAWQVRLPTDPVTQGIALRPVVIGGTAVFAEENAVYALRLTDGHQLWKRVFPEIGSDQSAGMVYGLWQYRGRVIVLVGQVSAHSRLFSFNSATGGVNWTLALGRQGETGNLTLTGDGGLAMIYGHATLTVVDLAAGRIRWGRTAGNSGGPVAIGGVVIAPAPGKVMGYNSRTGKLLWTRTGMPDQASLLVSAGRVFVLNDDQAVSPPVPLWPVTALSPATGRTLWRTGTGSPVYVQSAGPSGVAVATFGRKLTLIDATNGHVRVSVHDGDSMLPFDTGTDLLYLNGSPQGSRTTMADVHVADGSVRWSVPAPAAFNGLVFGFGGHAVVFEDAGNKVGDPGSLVAVGLTTGKHAWTVKVPALLQVPPLAAGANVILQPTDASYGCPLAGSASAVGTAR